MKITVLDAATLGSDLDLSPLSALGEVTVRQTTAPSELPGALADADAAVLNKVKITREVLENAPRLKIILVAATGYDNIDLAAARDHGVAVCNVPGYSAPTVAQVTLSMAFSLFTHLPEYGDFVKSGAYTAGGVANRLEPVYHDMTGKTFAVVGYGGIGSRVGAVAAAMGMDVLAVKRTPIPGVTCVSLEEAAGKADVMSLHLPLSDATRGLVSREIIGMMKPGAILINVARGAVTDEAAVADAVLSGHLGGFGCDVYSKEPMPEEHPFQAIRNLPNVILTPHMAWGSIEARERCLRVITENLAAFTRGEHQNRVD